MLPAAFVHKAAMQGWWAQIGMALGRFACSGMGAEGAMSGAQTQRLARRVGRPDMHVPVWRGACSALVCPERVAQCIALPVARAWPLHPIAISVSGRLAPTKRPSLAGPGPMTATPIGESQCIQLLHGLDRDIVRNTISGETVFLDGRHSLHFHDSGAACFVPAGAEEGAGVIWARSLLRGQVFVDESGDSFVYDLQDGTTTWTASFDEGASSSKGLTVNNGPVQGKLVIYISDWPKGAACLRWCLPHVITLVVGSNFDGRWISRRLKHFREVLAMAGLGPEHIFVSRRGKRATRTSASPSRTSSTSPLVACYTWCWTSPPVRCARRVWWTFRTSRAASLTAWWRG